MPVPPTSAARQRRCSGRGVFNHPRPTPAPPSLDRGYGPAGHLRCQWAYQPTEAAAQAGGWRAQRVRPLSRASNSVCEIEGLQQATGCARQRHSANDDASRPRGWRLPFAHPPSPSTDRTRKRASPIFCSHPPTLCLSVAAAAAQQCSAIRSSGIWGGLGHRRRLSSRSPSPAPFVARARGCGALGS